MHIIRKSRKFPGKMRLLALGLEENQLSKLANIPKKVKINNLSQQIYQKSTGVTALLPLLEKKYRVEVE